MQYKDPREALQDIINSNSTLKEDLIKSCSEENPRQSFFTNYVLIQEDTLKKITRTLQKFFHPDIMTSKEEFKDTENIAEISTEISQLINSGKTAIESKSTFNYEPSNLVYNFLIEQNPHAFIKILTGKKERGLKRTSFGYDWYDDKESYGYYIDYIDFIRKNDKDYQTQSYIDSEKNDLKKLSREILESKTLTYHKNYLKKLEEIKKLEKEIFLLNKQYRLLEKTLLFAKKGFDELSKNKIEIEDEKQRLKNLEIKLYERLANERKTLFSELTEAKILSGIEIDTHSKDLDKKELELKTKELILEQKEEKLNKKEIELISKEIELKDLEIRFNDENFRLEKWQEKLQSDEFDAEKIKAHAFETIDELIKSYEYQLVNTLEEKLSSKQIFSTDNLAKIRDGLVYLKDSYYEDELKKIKKIEIFFEDIENIDYKEMIKWYEIFKTPKKTKEIFRRFKQIIYSLKNDLNLYNLISYSDEFNKLFKNLNTLEKRKIFNIFLNKIINKIKTGEKIKLLKNLREIEDNEVFEGSYRDKIIKIIDIYYQNIKILEDTINSKIFEQKLLISLKNDKLEAKEIIQKGELDYLRRYNNFYSKLNDEKGGLTLAFEVDGRNPVEIVIYNIVQKLSDI